MRIALRAALACWVLFALGRGAAAADGPRVVFGFGRASLGGGDVDNIPEALFGVTIDGSEVGDLATASVGLTTTIEGTRAVSFETGVVLTLKGGTFEASEAFGGGSTNHDDLTLAVTYLEIPALATYSFGGPYVFGGVSLGIPVYEAVSYTTHATNAAGDVTGFFSDNDYPGPTPQLGPFDLAFVLGAGVSSGGFSLDVRYSLGLTSAMEITYEDTDTDTLESIDGIVHQTLSLMLAVEF